MHDRPARGPADELDLDTAPSLQNWRPLEPDTADSIRSRATLECGWGRLIFGHTFESSQDLLDELRREAPDKRDIAFYLRDPHVLLALAPHELFLDPSHTYRLALPAGLAAAGPEQSVRVRPLHGEADAEAMQAIYLRRRMAPVEPAFLVEQASRRDSVMLVAEDVATGKLVGGVLFVDHVEVFHDPERGSSLWCLAVDPQAPMPGVGRALVCALVHFAEQRGRSFVDLSVMHGNKEAIALYEQLGFRRAPAFCVKHKNPFNESLFMGSDVVEELNPYARILVDEARRRGIQVEVLDAENGYFRLQSGGRSIVCRESLTELCSAIAMSRCHDKRVTARLLASEGLRVPSQALAASPAENAAFLARHGRLAVKPRRGEQGRGISVDVRDAEALEQAIERARAFDEEVLLEELVEGQDLRVIVIDGEVVAAAVRQPASVTGTGRHTVLQLIEKQSRRRMAATDGESSIPLDEETRRCVRAGGVDLEDVLEQGRTLTVRRTANLHTGGTLHDVTERLHPRLREVSETAARALGIPVTGLDLLVPRVDGPEYCIIEANERPGLANHEPQPTAEAFIDVLFPESRARQREAGSQRNPGATS